MPKAQILDYADEYRVKYVGPNKANIYSLSLFLGLGIPIFLILGIYFVNDKIIDKSDLDGLTSIPVLGSILLKKDMENNFIVGKSLKSVISESFRNIRTNLNYMVDGRDNYIVLVTSSVSGEGKTFTSINLAAIYAALGLSLIHISEPTRPY